MNGGSRSKESGYPYTGIRLKSLIQRNLKSVKNLKTTPI